MAAELSLRFTNDVAAMHRALDLARRGWGFVEPNPPVGAVVVDADGHCLGEGWHTRFGAPHAEVEALAAAGTAARGATLYVTLEPCAHVGKTPPCVDAILAAGIGRVVAAVGDPAPHNSGRGFARLRQAGIPVEVGVCEEAAQALLAPFALRVTRQRAYVHAKWAMTLDGKLASRSGCSQWISNECSRERVHQLRGRMDAILVGIGTAQQDDPLLTARPSGPRIPTRIVLDRQARLSTESQLLRTLDQAPLLVVTNADAPRERTDPLQAAGADVWHFPPCADDDDSGTLLALLQYLSQRGMTNVLVEGGSGILGAFWDEELINEVHCFIATKLIGGNSAVSPLGGLGIAEMSAAVNLTSVAVENLNGDLYVRGRVLPTQPCAG